MTADEALMHFLGKALLAAAYERYASLLATKGGKKKLLVDLWHRFGERLDMGKCVSELPNTAWVSPAYSFSQQTGFGREEESLRSAMDCVKDGSLIIAREGLFGVYRPEDYADDTKYIRV